MRTFSGIHVLHKCIFGMISHSLLQRPSQNTAIVLEVVWPDCFNIINCTIALHIFVYVNSSLVRNMLLLLETLCNRVYLFLSDQNKINKVFALCIVTT